MGSGQKKVIVRRFSPGLLRGYLPATGFVSRKADSPVLQLLDLAGRVQDVPLHDVKIVHFVREFNLTDEANPERLPRKQFLARPRTEGLWVRLAFRDGDDLEGLAALDLSLAAGLADDLGIQLVPPDVRGNSQRVYVPRSALSALQVVAVVTTPTRRKQLEQISAKADEPVPQADLFPDAVATEVR
ncbi:DUF6982 domain-containing protein [Terriglobus aquaticus]|uniref:DUF6982 domain-containing protein n=1 Tax=Terriglobus aquaticus TaxID=940139 RepID=A0ABW9KJD2_9BACT|nr:hypothetical protein [Terriglobus aquaticus]